VARLEAAAAVVIHAACQDHQAPQEIQVDQDDQENQAPMVSQEIQASRPSNLASQLLHHHANHARKALQDQQDHQDLQAMPVNQDNQDNQDKTLHLANRDQKDHRDHQDSLANPAHQEKMVPRRPHRQVNLGPPDQLETKDHQDHQDLPETQAATPDQDQPDQRDLQDHQDLQETTDSPVLPASLARQETQEKRVSARNTAPWTEVSSSKMELVAVKKRDGMGSRSIGFALLLLFFHFTSMQKNLFDVGSLLE
jgi:hypothetical protein